MVGMVDSTSYEERKVARNDWPDGRMLSTAVVTDASYEYETAFSHPEYNDGEIIILGGTDDREEAVTFHNKWVKMMDDDTLPDVIRDNGGSGINELLDLFDNDWRNYKRERKPKG